jgi:hypothetical protein
MGDHVYPRFIAEATYRISMKSGTGSPKLLEIFNFGPYQSNMVKDKKLVFYIKYNFIKTDNLHQKHFSV